MDVKAGLCLGALCGLPGAGKSTLCHRLIEHLAAQPGFQAHVVCVDDAVAQAAGGAGQEECLTGAEFSPEAWKAGRQAALRTLERLLSAGSCDKGPPFTLVLLDDTLHYRSLRHECYQLASKYRAYYLQLHVRCPLELALERNTRRPPGSRVPPAVIAHTAAIFEDPFSSPYGWERRTLVVDLGPAAEGPDVEELWSRIWGAWGPAPPPPPDAEEEERQRQQARQETAESALHQLELACRRQVAECMQRGAQLSPGARAHLARRLHELKRGVLAAAREDRAVPAGEARACCGSGQTAEGGGTAEGPSGGGGSVPPPAEGDGPGCAAGATCSDGHAVHSMQAALACWVGAFHQQCEAELEASQRIGGPAGVAGDPG